MTYKVNPQVELRIYLRTWRRRLENLWRQRALRKNFRHRVAKELRKRQLEPQPQTKMWRIFLVSITGSAKRDGKWTFSILTPRTPYQTWVLRNTLPNSGDMRLLLTDTAKKKVICSDINRHNWMRRSLPSIHLERSRISVCLLKSIWMITLLRRIFINNTEIKKILKRS